MKGSFEFARLISVIILTFTHTRHNYSEGFIYIILEEMPKYGTLILSLISGYLYYSVSKNSKKLFSKKIKTLAIPYLIANLSVLIIVLLANILFDLDYLVRLGYDIRLFLDGILSLSSPPINPPTFFIRDIFIIFVLIEVVINKKFLLSLLLIPILIYGELILRYEILFLFITGVVIARYITSNNKTLIAFNLLVISCTLFFFEIIEIRHLVSIQVFILIVGWNINFPNVGGYTYLLHLYHSPVIVFIFPIINNYISNPVVSVFLQIILSIIIIYILFKITRRYTFLSFLSGQR